MKKEKKTAIGINLEKRGTVLFTRVSPSIKTFISESAAKKGISESAFVSYIIALYKKENA